MENHDFERALSAGEFRRLALEETKRQLQFAAEVAESDAAGGFVRRIPPPLITQLTFQEVFEQIVALQKEIVTKFPNLRTLADQSVELARGLLTARAADSLLELYRNLLSIYGFQNDPNEDDSFSVRADQKNVYLDAKAIGDDPDGVPANTVESDRADHSFVAAVANMIADVRRQGRVLTQDERSAVLTAYKLLDKGVQVPSAFKSIGISGFREHQTNLSVANPGDGHLQVTCASMKLLAGTVVHIEHIDRDGERDREKMEPYRLPAIINAARVRLHAGAAAPCTAYIGRPVFESGFVERDMLKSVHMTSGACTSMFMNGIADCKIGIERMKASEAIAFMRAVAGNVVRDPTRQYLSAAFNINLPVTDDRAATVVQIVDRFEIALLGIDLALDGRFEKVTWDGSSNQEPSVPIIEQLKFEQLLELVHVAHEKGLETYISAGLQPFHMRDCVYMGVDGVGIGTSLHDYNPVSGLRGQLKAERVREVLDVRDQAASESLGRGAFILAQMDRMYFEGTLQLSLDAKRRQLFELMRDRHEKYVEELLLDIGGLPGSEASGGHPVLEQAKRVLVSAAHDTVGQNRDDNWEEFVSSVADLVENRDITQLYEVLP